MTRYFERDALRELLAGSADPHARELAAVMAGSQSLELVAASPVTAAMLLPTYEVRLRRAAAGVGPNTQGLARFVEALRDQDVTELFGVAEGNFTGIGLLTSLGDVAAVTLVRRPDVT